ncbi:hypothetical protein [Pontibacter sp. G13]|uniref:hypothetical protein n=1 Tax=Pontibacter sp. G13 TaxID=3074898 RepID=UPI002889AEA4|nr:hypothetical protein [Pontibacter sp. G13]WNJ19688.1 hypothetical protein RJD25_04330 [Pontibacter sp. G13]
MVQLLAFCRQLPFKTTLLLLVCLYGPRDIVANISDPSGFMGEVYLKRSRHRSSPESLPKTGMHSNDEQRSHQIRASHACPTILPLFHFREDSSSDISSEWLAQFELNSHPRLQLFSAAFRSGIESSVWQQVSHTPMTFSLAGKGIGAVAIDGKESSFGAQLAGCQAGVFVKEAPSFKLLPEEGAQSTNIKSSWYEAQVYLENPGRIPLLEAGIIGCVVDAG